MHLGPELDEPGGIVFFLGVAALLGKYFQYSFTMVVDSGRRIYMCDRSC
jgi:hypothetical protein